MSRLHGRALLMLSILVSAQGAARLAGAESTNAAAAQALFDQAKQLMTEGHVAEACPKLEESQRLDPGSGTLLNLANCYEQTGRLATAWTTYLETASAAKTSGNTQRESEARRRAAVIAPQLSKLVITIDPETAKLPQLQVTQDGVLIAAPEWGLPLPADVGEHELDARAPGYVPFHAKVEVVGGGATTTTSVPKLNLAMASSVTAGAAQPTAPAEPAPSGKLGTQKVAALLAGGAGVAGLALGTFFGLQSKSKHDDATQLCPRVDCSDPRGVNLGNDARSAGNLSTAMMIVGAVGVAAGVTLWVSAPKAESSASARVGLGPGSVQLVGAW